MGEEAPIGHELAPLIAEIVKQCEGGAREQGETTMGYLFEDPEGAEIYYKGNLPAALKKVVSFKIKTLREDGGTGNLVDMGPAAIGCLHLPCILCCGSRGCTPKTPCGAFLIEYGDGKTMYVAAGGSPRPATDFHIMKTSLRKCEGLTELDRDGFEEGSIFKFEA